MKYERQISIFIFVLYFLSIIGLILIYRNPTSGYEVSIYTSNIYIWILFIFSSLGAINLLIYFIFSEKIRKLFIIATLFLIIFNNFIVLSMPELRGYVIYGDGDFLTHIGYIKDIISHGYIYNNIYPVSHILITNISLLGNVSIIQVANYISQFFSIFYIVLIYILSKKIFNNNIQIKLILLSSFPFLFSSVAFFQVELKPQFLSLIVIPMILYFLFSKSLFPSRLVLILLIILMQFFHPLTSIFFILSFSLILLYKMIEKDYYEINTIYKYLLSISIISFFLWTSTFFYSRFGKWLGEIRGTKTTSALEVATPVYGIEKMHFSNFEIMELFTRMFGHILIYLIISLICIIYYLKFKEKKGSTKIFELLFIVFLSGIILEIINIIGGGLNLGITRGLAYVLILTPIFVGTFFHQIKKKYATIGIIIVMSIISISWIIGLLNIFPSPYIHQPNDQVTNRDIKAAEWFLDYKNPELRFISGRINIRFSQLILGINATYARDDISKYIVDKSSMIPDHFDYDKRPQLGMSFSKDMYMVISKFDIDLYTTGPWRPVGRFRYEDFNNLNYDKSVNNLYDNGEANIYYITI